MRHDEARTGLWAASSSEEEWCCYDFFDTREEAIQFGLAEHGSRFWTGQVVELTDREVALAIIRDQEDANEQFEEDHWGWVETTMLKVSPEAETELEKLVTEWVARRKVRVPTWRIEDPAPNQHEPKP